MAIFHAHDKLFKAAFSNQAVATAFLTSQLPPDVRQLLDLNALALVANSFVDETLSEHFADLVYQCPCQMPDGIKSSVRIVLLFEHKSYVVRYPHLQLMRYLTNAWEMDEKQGQSLGIIIPIVIFHGSGQWHQVPMATYFPGVQTAHAQFIPAFNYLFYNLSAMPDEAIVNFSNRFLALSTLLLKYSREESYLQRIGNQLKQLIGDLAGEDTNLLKAAIVYLYNTHTEKTRGQVLVFLQNINSPITQLTMTMYESILRDGELKGRLDTQTETVRKMLLTGKLTVSEIAGYASVSAEFVRQVQQQMQQ